MISLGALCAFGSSLTWALGTSQYSRLAREHSPVAVNFGRALFALPCFIALAFASAGGWAPGLAAYSRVEPAALGWFSLSAVASYALGDSLFLLSTRSLGVPGALAIASVYPLWTALAAMAQGEPVSPGRALGLALTVLGVVVVVLNQPRGPEDPATPERRGLSATIRRSPGAVFALLTSFCWTLNTLSVSRGGQGLDLAVANSLRMTLAMVATAILGRLLLPRSPLILPSRVFRTGAWVFVVEAFGGSALFMYGLTHAPLAVAGALSSLAPVVAVPFALALGLEKFSVYRTLGVCLVVQGVILLV